MRKKSLLDGFAVLAAQGGNDTYFQPMSRMSWPPAAPGNLPEHCYTITLFQRNPKGPPPARKDLIAALLPPPSEASEADLLAWLRGDIVDVLAPAIAIPYLSEDPDGLADLVARWRADKMFCFGDKDRRAISEITPCLYDAGFLYAQAEHSDTAAEGDRRAAAVAFADAIAAILERFEPRCAHALNYHGAVLRVSKELAEAISRGRKIEAAWTAKFTEGVNPDREAIETVTLGRESAVLKRTAYFHLVTSRPVISALREALLEMRHALTRKARAANPVKSPSLR
jgi:hypothetical protein